MDQVSRSIRTNGNAVSGSLICTTTWLVQFALGAFAGIAFQSHDGAASKLHPPRLNHHGILLHQGQWNKLMTTFCDEAHILVPFLHLPSS